MSDRQGQAGAAGLGSEQPAKPGEAQGAEEGGQLQAEIRLRQEIEQRLSLFHQFVEASREGMGWADLDGNVRYMNPALGHMVGEKRPEDSYGKPVLRYYSEEAQRLLREEIFPTILREGMWTGEIALQSLTGQTVPTANSLFVLRDEQNRPASFANVVTDLTERKQAEEELRRHRNHLEELVTRRTADLARTNRELQHEIAERRIVEARLQRLDTAVAQSIDGVVMSDLEGVIEFANPAWARMHGFAVSDVLGRHISLFHSREQMDREVSPFIARILTDGAAEGEVGHVCRTGESFPAWQTGTYIKDEEGRPMGLLGIARDISERKLAEQERARLLAILELTSDLVFMATPDAHLTYLNCSGRLMVGWGRNEDLADHHIQDLHPRWAFELIEREGLPAALRDGIWMGETTLLHRNGTEVPVSQVIMSHRSRTGQLEYFSTIMRDMTARKAAERALQRAHEEMEQRVRDRTAELEAALRELESFSYSVSHDLRAPLRAINGFSRILLEDHHDRLDAEGQNYLHRICRATERMGELIDDLLQLSRVTRHELRHTTIDLSAMAQQIARELTAAWPARQIEFVIAEGLAAQGDEHLIETAMRNLLDNAVKYTSRAPQARIEFGATEISGDRIFYVKDNGIGFDMQYKDKLFAAFQRLHSEKEFPGTGIGLSVVHRVIAKHRGRIWAESSEGKGAVFYFTLGEA